MLSHNSAIPRIIFNPPPAAGTDLFHSVADQVSITVAIADIESRQFGAAPYGNGKFLLTVDHGILLVDTTNQTAEWKLTMEGCYGDPVLHHDSVLIQRKHGIGRYDNGTLTAVSTGASTSLHSHLLSKSDGTAWCFDAGVSNHEQGSPAALIQIGENVGDEQVKILPYDPGTANGGAWLNTTDITISSPQTLSALNYPFTSEKISLPSVGSNSITSFDSQKIFILDVTATLWIVDTATGQRTPIWKIKESVDVLFCRLIPNQNGSNTRSNPIQARLQEPQRTLHDFKDRPMAVSVGSRTSKIR
ncbi:MAG: hypothetical protein ABIQ18_12020 [Umezawaea sp.]